MKKSILLFFLIVVFCWFASAQEQNQVDAQNRKQGIWKKYDENQKLIYEGVFKDDIPIDTFRYYHVNGQVKAITYYLHAGNNCKTTLYDENGTKIAEGNYVRRNKEGTWNYFDDKTQKIRAIENYKDGIPDGIWSVYYDDGKTISETTEYKAGKKEGMRVSFFENGNKKQEMSYKSGVAEGTIKYFHPSGVLRGIGQYQNDKREGVWTYYDELGEITEKDIYEHGIQLEKEENEQQ
jgi:antitoxin component YwqK of YwqJK toxin-antitoxin module